MKRQTAFRVLSGTMGTAFILLGLALTATFFGYQEPGSTPSIPTGPVGHYFIAFSGCALVGWGGGLIGAARRQQTTSLVSRTIATATALALVLMSVVRMAAWVVGDYHMWAGDVLRGEAAFFLLLALAFLWLRPPIEQEARD